MDCSLFKKRFLKQALMKTASLALVLLAQQALALTAGERLPAIPATLEELTLENNQVVTQASELGELTGKLYTVYHLAPRIGMDELHKPYFDALEAAGLSPEQHQVVTVVNMDEAAWGTTGMVKSRLEDKFKKHPEGRFLLDSNASVKRAWGLKDKSAVIVLLKQDGTILTVKEGAIDVEEVAPLLNLLKQQL